jgi:3',5'-cyclic AMP phosphodiesterase CpdA
MQKLKLGFLFWILLCCLFASPVFSSSSEEAFSFAVFGDNQGNNPALKTLIGRINKDPSIELVVNVGDLVDYPTEENIKRYLALTSELPPRLYRVAGNHDMQKGGDKLFAKYYGPSYYSFDHKNAHFIVLDNAFKESFDYAQFDWLKSDLASTTQRNIFVFMHRPTFDPTEIHKGYIMSGRKTVEELMALFKKYKVKYVFAGHIHGFAKDTRDGVTYVVTGGGGAPLYLPPEFGGFFHYTKVSVDGEKVKEQTVLYYEE